MKRFRNSFIACGRLQIAQEFTSEPSTELTAGNISIVLHVLEARRSVSNASGSTRDSPHLSLPTTSRLPPTSRSHEPLKNLSANKREEGAAVRKTAAPFSSW